MVLTTNSLHTSMFNEIRWNSDIRGKKQKTKNFYTNYKNKIFAVINRNIIGDNIVQFCLGMGGGVNTI